MFGSMGIQELIILMMVIGVLSMTGLCPRTLQGLRELRGESPPDRDNSAQDMEM